MECKHALFIDIDYEKLMRLKCKTIQSTSQLTELIPDFAIGESNDPFELRSAHYVAAACDLSDANALRNVLSSLKLENYAVLFVAEVSMTYMEVKAADAVIKTASEFHNAKFCLLEQWMPDGPHHPFASTMIKHFDKLNSPLKAPMQYQDSESLRQRFQTNGWQYVNIRSLWSLWSDESFLCTTDRAALEQIEQFDEWEEFALFSSHYFLLVAESESFTAPKENGLDVNPLLVQAHAKSSFSPYVAEEQLHRYSAPFKTGKSIICHGGLGTRGRVSNSFIYSVDRQGQLSNRDTFSIEPSLFPPMETTCHTITHLHHGTLMLVGGRTAPNLALQSCSLFRNGTWHQVADLPRGSYRHSAVAVQTRRSVPSSTTVLIFGGRNSSGDALCNWLLWDPDAGRWLELEIVGDAPPARFAASMSVDQTSHNEGHISGGIGTKGTVITDLWHWKLVTDDQVTKVKCTNKSALTKSSLRVGSCFGRFGASLVEHATDLLLIGGVGASGLISSSEAILKLDNTGNTSIYTFEASLPKPLLVGHSLEINISSENALSMAITGGGAVCFSFGTYWNAGSYSISISQSRFKIQPWMIASGHKAKTPLPGASLRNHSNVLVDHQSFTVTNIVSSRVNGCAVNTLAKDWPAVVHVASTTVPTGESFKDIMDSASPRVLKSLHIGTCTATWDLEYLTQKIGADRQVTVHSSHSAHMDFLEKNFQYKTIPFAEFVERVQSGERTYLRALSSEKPTQKPTKLEDDFPGISEDFKLPLELEYVTANLHSSPLRISGPVNMWLHFDVMANVLCQIRGRKRLVLFHPSNADRLNIPHGASSSQVSVFDDDGQLRPDVEALGPMICDLEPGDALFIPALWPHAAYPTDGVSIAVNVFFRSLEAGYAAGKDTYGNRDVQAYENGRKDIQRIQKSFQNLPSDFKTFYIKRLAEELADSIPPGAQNLGGDIPSRDIQQPCP